ncbi:hypothetical protein [Tropicimonas marinistellae]|uniref:hypothetical protein n=1 Tax=Tropicimonas marinistellae TaxID=1739787 RepID=UPI000833D80E|nr:hypothetical protein [Tropicimonas marinistellae]
MKSQNIQLGLAAIFLGLGGWCLVAPRMVERLVLTPEYQHLSATSALLLGCFGAQAILAGLVIALSRFTPMTFLVFGLVGSVPFFVFNFYFVFVVELFTYWMLLDFVGNLGILACGILGYRIRTEELNLAGI